MPVDRRNACDSGDVGAGMAVGTGRWWSGAALQSGAITLVVLLLPICVWLDLRNLSDRNLRNQAETLNRVVSAFRQYYSTHVVSRIMDAGGAAHPTNLYEDRPGGIPIPATLSIELAAALRSEQDSVAYRFVSEYPFANRASHNLTEFERSALRRFEADPVGLAMLTDVSGGLRDRQVTVATPVLMGGGCVTCHNAHPDSPKTDWKIGDVRGIQTFTVSQPLTLNIWSFQWILTYMAFSALVAVAVSTNLFKRAREFQALSRRLIEQNSFLSEVSRVVSKYIPTQVFDAIFRSGAGRGISTERKKLTVFFSDIRNFTATTEQLQPEDLTAILNEYFSEMSAIAEAHGATIDKFIGDAIVAFFGDPTSQGVREDARACVRMAIAMQKRLRELNVIWRDRGYEHPFQVRIGINTGICNVGNFGSESRMDYTIIGAEANLAARLESIAEPGGIVMSYETWVHVRDEVPAQAMEPVRFKGIAREVVPYRWLTDDREVPVVPEDKPAVGQGMTVSIDVADLDGSGRLEIERILVKARDVLRGDKGEG